MDLAACRWQLTRVGGPECVAFEVPGDVHSALFAEGVIDDPYWRDKEISLDWVHEADWVASCEFFLDDVSAMRQVLSLDGLDCIAVVSVNGVEVGRGENQFLRHDFDVAEALKPGANRLDIRFLSSSRLALEAARGSPIAIPHSKNCRIPATNFLRKTACHAGWDWNIALSPVGLYGSARLRSLTDGVRLDDIKVQQHHEPGRVRLVVTAFTHVQASLPSQLHLWADEQHVQTSVTLYPGINGSTVELIIEDPELWWPVGHGHQHQYTVRVRLGDQEREMSVGLRDVTLLTDQDSVGHRFALAVNGREIFMRGANWIPADALPARASREVVRDRLQSAVEANMNMIRIWGGGQYEADWFLELCNELGLMVWQDFMLACNLYPAFDRNWLDQVRCEASQQVRRLSRHACVILWCGDNELVGALNWFDVSRQDRDRYLVIYDRLNHALETVIQDEQPGIPFWPSSPSVGRLNYGDGWHDDRSGDMHFWDVWHESKDFEHYRSVRPRFCSEFGFQSFPSMPVIERFTEPADRNVSSRVMEVHQRNVGGNSRIVETIARYFRFPERFDDLCYLSQITQGLAMQTAVEFWRSNKPRCMGTLYWQLNDTWPVVSWSSLEYGGAWKVLHYMARRFYAPVMICARPQPDGRSISVVGVCDLPLPVDVCVRVELVDVTGSIHLLAELDVTLPADSAIDVQQVPCSNIPQNAFLHMSWCSPDGLTCGESEYLPRRPKDYDFQKPTMSVTERLLDDGETVIELCSDRPALYVTYDHGGERLYSDNAFTLLPGRVKQLRVVRQREAVASGYKVADLQYLRT